MSTCQTLVQTATYPETREGTMVASLATYAKCEKETTGYDARGRDACEEHKV